MGSESLQPDGYDMECRPLLPIAQSKHRNDSARRASRVAKLVVHNAVIVLLSFLITAVTAVLCVYFGGYRGISSSGRASICLSPSCIHASSEILYNLSPNYESMDPCTDFERMACAGWDERYDLRPDQGAVYTGTLMGERSQMLLRHLLEAQYVEELEHLKSSPIQRVGSLSSDRDNFIKLKTAYDACMDETAIKKYGIEPLKEILDQIADNFPLNDTDRDDCAHTISFLAKLGVPALIQNYVRADDNDPDAAVAQVVPPFQIGLPAKDFYENEIVVRNYEAALSQIIENVFPVQKGNSTLSINWKENRRSSVLDHSKELAHKVVELEKKLAVASPSPQDRNDITKSYNPMSLEEADLLAPEIQLSSIINGLSPSNFQTDRVIVSSPRYMKSLSETLTQTSTEVLQAYFMWKFIQTYFPSVEADEIKPYSRFSNELQGKDSNSNPERWRFCVQHVDRGLGWILSRFFVERAFSAKSKEMGDQIVSDIKDAFVTKLESTDWMEKAVKELAVEKVHKISQKIGYPTKSPNITDSSVLGEYYRLLNISASAFFENTLSMNRFDVSRTWAALEKPIDRDQWVLTVPTVNAYYSPPGNEIVFPAGIMQFPSFNVDVPQYLNYGVFGSIAGHELLHAFDSTGRHYDQNGNYTDWWTNSTVEVFEQRAQCYVDQYAKFAIPGPDGEPLHVNGRLTLGENIADASGVSAAFAAWKKRQAETPSEDLPGLSFFTQDQLFFVSYANWWCSKSRPETAISKIYSDTHAPKWARILGTLANSRDFKKSFNCPSQEPVCELW